MSTMEDKRYKCSVSFLINPQIVTGSVQPSAAVTRPSEIKNVNENSSSKAQPQIAGLHLNKSNDAFDKIPDILDRSSWSEEEEAALILMRMRFDDSSKKVSETSESLAKSRPQRKKMDKKKPLSQKKQKGNSNHPHSAYAGRLRRR